MSNLVHVPKSGSLSNTNSNTNFPLLSNWLDAIFNQDLPSVFTSNYNEGLSLPKVNIKETTDAYTIEMAVPGFKKSDFKLQIDHQVLSVATEQKEENEVQHKNYTRREFGFASFKRTFNLPESVNDAKIEASYTDGILTINLPKKEEAKQQPVRTIQIS